MVSSRTETRHSRIMATGGAAFGGDSSFRDFECPICREYFDTPCSLKCDHIFCLECIVKHFNRNQGQNQQKCPVCQTMVNVYLKRPADAVLEKMKITWTQCPDCNTKVSLADYKKHQSQCVAGAGSSNVRPPAEFEPRRFDMNRFTFNCPYCTAMHLDRESLLTHCQSVHATDGNHQRVCPICAAMPWGAKDMKSGHLLQHMQLRHQFDYDFYVNFELSEEDQMLVAMEESRRT